MRQSVQLIFAVALVAAAVAVAHRPAHAQAEAKVSCKDGSSYTVSVPGGSCKAVPGEYATCVGGSEGTESKAVCGGGCTSGGDGKCEAKTASTQPVGPGQKIRPEAGPKPAGIKTTSGGNDAQKNKIGVVAEPPAGVKGTTEPAKSVSKPTLQDMTTTKSVDKSSPALMASDARNLCSKNPACRVVRDDADLAVFCVGDNCVAARKAGKGQQEYLKVTMRDIMVGKVSGSPIKTSQGIIAILIGNVAPTSTKSKEPGKLETPNVKASTVKGESGDAKHKDALRAPPPTNLLESGPTVAPASSGPSGGTRIKSIREDVTVPSGPGGPMVK